MLLEEQRRVTDAISYLHEDNHSTLEDQLEEETFDNHPADSATGTLDREIDYSLEENAGNVLAAINAALERIEAGSFGKCVRCGQPIAVERLEAIPYATKCIECKRLEARG